MTDIASDQLPARLRWLTLAGFALCVAAALAVVMFWRVDAPAFATERIINAVDGDAVRAQADTERARYAQQQRAFEQREAERREAIKLVDERNEQERLAAARRDAALAAQREERQRYFAERAAADAEVARLEARQKQAAEDAAVAATAQKDAAEAVKIAARETAEASAHVKRGGGAQRRSSAERHASRTRPTYRPRMYYRNRYTGRFMHWGSRADVRDDPAAMLADARRDEEERTNDLAEATATAAKAKAAEEQAIRALADVRAREIVEPGERPPQKSAPVGESAPTSTSPVALSPPPVPIPSPLATPVPPLDPIEAALNNAAQPLKVAIQIPTEVELGHSYKARLIVERGGGSTSVDKVVASTGKGVAQSFVTASTDEVGAFASGERLVPKPTETDAWKVLRFANASTWEWTIEPSEQGAGVFLLELRQKLFVGGRERIVNVDHFPVAVAVKVTAWSRVAMAAGVAAPGLKNAEDIIKGLTAIITAITTTWLMRGKIVAFLSRLLRRRALNTA